MVHSITVTPCDRIRNSPKKQRTLENYLNWLKSSICRDTQKVRCLAGLPLQRRREHRRLEYPHKRPRPDIPPPGLPWQRRSPRILAASSWAALSSPCSVRPGALIHHIPALITTRQVKYACNSSATACQNFNFFEIFAITDALNFGQLLLNLTKQTNPIMRTWIPLIQNQFITCESKLTCNLAMDVRVCALALMISACFPCNSCMCELTRYTCQGQKNTEEIRMWNNLNDKSCRNDWKFAYIDEAVVEVEAKDTRCSSTVLLHASLHGILHNPLRIRTARCVIPHAQCRHRGQLNCHHHHHHHHSPETGRRSHPLHVIEFCPLSRSRSLLVLSVVPLSQKSRAISYSNSLVRVLLQLNIMRITERSLLVTDTADCSISSHSPVHRSSSLDVRLWIHESRENSKHTSALWSQWCSWSKNFTMQYWWLHSKRRQLGRRLQLTRSQEKRTIQCSSSGFRGDTNPFSPEMEAIDCMIQDVPLDHFLQLQSVEWNSKTRSISICSYGAWSPRLTV